MSAAQKTKTPMMNTTRDRRMEARTLEEAEGWATKDGFMARTDQKVAAANLVRCRVSKGYR